MNRRSFFGTLLGGFVAAVAPKPDLNTLFKACYPPAQIAAAINIPVRKMMARVRLTEEAMRDLHPGAFSTFMRDEWSGLARDIAAREEAALLD